MRAILCDIDGTLADCRHRLHHVLPGTKRDWNAFFAAMGEDIPIDPVADLVIAARCGAVSLVLCSGRPETYRPETEAWLKRYTIHYDQLYMRPAGDTRADNIVKGEMLDRIKSDGWDPFIVIDDRESVVRMWRERGLVCLQAAPNVSEMPASARLTLMVGPSGGGKSFWLRSNAQIKDSDGIQRSIVGLGIFESHIISSDNVRADLCGDFRDQSRNQEVFAAVHDIALARLRHGLPVVIDATHLRRKDRMTAARLVPERIPVRYVVIDRPEAEKRRDGGWRNELGN